MSESDEKQRLPADADERNETLAQLEDWLEGPVLVLGFIWLLLLVIEFTYGLNPLLNALVYLIWGIFLLDFAVRFALAPRKGVFLRKNWLTALSLAVPALRVLRIARLARVAAIARAGRGLRLVKVVGSLNRSMRALRSSMGRRGLGYVILLTLLVTFAGAAGMYAFEQEVPSGGFPGFADALWWTAMIMTTLGSGYSPVSGEGRLLALLLALYAFAVFGYVTASLATFFIGREVQSEPALNSEQMLQSLRDEVRALRAEINARQVKDGGDTPGESPTDAEV